MGVDIRVGDFLVFAAPSGRSSAELRFGFVKDLRYERKDPNGTPKLAAIVAEKGYLHDPKGGYVRDPSGGLVRDWVLSRTGSLCSLYTHYTLVVPPEVVPGRIRKMMVEA